MTGACGARWRCRGLLRVLAAAKMPRSSRCRDSPARHEAHGTQSHPGRGPRRRRRAGHLPRPGQPELEVVAVTATGGNVAPRQASRNVQAIIEHLDPPRWPRIGFAHEDQPLRTDGRELWGVDGFCGAELGVVELHQQHPSVKVLTEEIRSAPGEVTVIAGGPLSNIAAAFQREPDLAMLIGHLIIVGGTLDGPGDVTAAAEFNIYCDAEAAQRVFRSRGHQDAAAARRDQPGGDDVRPAEPPARRSRRRWAACCTPCCRGRSNRTASGWGSKGMYVPEAVAVAAAMHPELLTTEAWPCDVETEGVLTHGATVIDRRRHTLERGTMDVAVEARRPRGGRLHSPRACSDDGVDAARRSRASRRSASAAPPRRRRSPPGGRSAPAPSRIARRAARPARPARPMSESFTRLMRCWSFSIGVPLKRRMTSSICRPASAAGERGGHVR